MAKFHVKLKLQALEIEVSGEREDIPIITQNLGQQLGGLLEPAANMAGQRTPSDNVISPHTILEPKRVKPTRRTTANKAASNAGSEPPAWRHDPDKWGNPQQAWNPVKKSIWLLFVASNQGGPNEFTAGQIATTFNGLFRSSGTLRGSNVSRDLGKAQTEAPPLVGKSPQDAFFLTEAGKKLGTSLVQEARGIFADTK